MGVGWGERTAFERPLSPPLPLSVLPFDDVACKETHRRRSAEAAAAAAGIVEPRSL